LKDRDFFGKFIIINERIESADEPMENAKLLLVFPIGSIEYCAGKGLPLVCT
jgi:hypothetical protein